MNKNPIPPNVQGVTLLELLIAVAIVLILAVLALVVFQKIRDTSRGAQNIANHRIIAGALIQSAYDNNGALPYCDHGPAVKLSYPRYLAEKGYISDPRVFFTPHAGGWYNNHKNALRRPDIPTIIPWYFTNYGVNRLGAMPHSQDDDGRKPARLPVVGADGNMSKLMLLRDTYRAGYDTESNPYGGGICFFSWPGWPYTPPKHKTYGGMVHASFADGHVEAFTLSEVKKIAEQPPDGAPQFQNRYTRY